MPTAYGGLMRRQHDCASDGSARIDSANAAVARLVTTPRANAPRDGLYRDRITAHLAVNPGGFAHGRTAGTTRLVPRQVG
jgi:hypothetical protein